MDSHILAIDPGKNGGIALVSLDGTAQAWKMPETERDIWSLIVGFDDGDTFALIEKVGPNRIAADGERRQGASSMFTFGMGYGALRMALVASGIPWEDISPQRWQSLFGLKRFKDETTVEKKNRHKARAQQLFPALQITHAKADALLIAEYGRRTRQHVGNPAF
jgi:hypothetical protein